ncbi:MULTISPECIES: VOC family protein [Streptomyces]|uniref:VOC family protein n=1 Tax=Streptomyces lycii TaxID=2654337 RepID=A0ABQ7FET4_9ACTN|nr:MULTISPECIES: VOC family protein [Streptomyces]KAF4407325.1 VOC family protein [Streptomyces lycii]PGH48652.1 glyoxalase [Streptomyces sp. Ru87]
MATQIFVNLPVKDLQRSKDFWSALGYSANPQFSDENAASIVISDEIYVMVMTEPFFKTFTKKEIADATRTTEAINCLGVGSRAEVDRLVDAALAAGGSASNETMEEGPMYGRSFQDPDGHLWEVVYMDMSAMQ